MSRERRWLPMPDAAINCCVPEPCIALMALRGVDRWAKCGCLRGPSARESLLAGRAHGLGGLPLLGLDLSDYRCLEAAPVSPGLGCLPLFLLVGAAHKQGHLSLDGTSRTREEPRDLLPAPTPHPSPTQTQTQSPLSPHRLPRIPHQGLADNGVLGRGDGHAHPARNCCEVTSSQEI